MNVEFLRGVKALISVMTLLKGPDFLLHLNNKFLLLHAALLYI